MTDEKKLYRIEGRESTIFRVRGRDQFPYVITDRRPVDNPKLSYKAKGILTYLLSRPDGWEVNVPDLVNHSTDGAASIRTGLKELRDAGHIHYNVQREGGYIKCWVIEVYEVPEIEAQSNEGESVLDDDFRNVGTLDSDFLQVGNQQVGNRREVLSTLSTKELIYTSPDDDFAQVAKKLATLSKRSAVLNATSADYISDWLKDHKVEWILKAIDKAIEKNGRRQEYVDVILEDWKEHGYPSQAAPRNYGGGKQKLDIDAILGITQNG
jgi:DnaD/phage-associated family protein